MDEYPEAVEGDQKLAEAAQEILDCIDKGQEKTFPWEETKSRLKE
ncbi:hypothetical protein [Candidatus Neptunochlamydia vexilliferae]|nr:hypothetical protein [Candidatus Neptunochlamydia vexilliferae]